MENELVCIRGTGSRVVVENGEVGGPRRGSERSKVPSCHHRHGWGLRRILLGAEVFIASVTR